MFHAVLGTGVLFGIALILSEDRSRIPWRTVAGGVMLQFLFAGLFLGIPSASKLLMFLNEGAIALHHATETGTRFVFGYLAGPPLPFAEVTPGSSFILAFQSLPLVLTISALASLLLHWGILQRVVRIFAAALQRLMGVGGALSLGAAVHVFVGMVEAPLLIQPYLARMQRGELFALMSCGLAGVAGTVMVVYASIIGTLVPNALGNILVASIVSTPAALAIAAIMVPFGRPEAAEARLVIHDPPTSAMDALVKGTLNGIPLLAAIIATLLVTVALITLINNGMAWLPSWDDAPITLQRLLAFPFRPVMWLIGVPWAETALTAKLMATKTVLNEFVAYLDFASLPADALSPGTRMIMTYALCGFANFGSVGIMVGGMGVMVPERRHEIVALGIRSMVAGTLATCMSGALAGAFA